MCQLLFYYQKSGDLNPALAILDQAISRSGHHRLTECFDEFAVDVYTLQDDNTSRTIAIDFDNTITADVDFYLNLIDAYQAAGWNPVICTLRDRDAENLSEMRAQLCHRDIRIYTCGGRPKQQTLLSLGIRVNLWIDDYFPAICPCGSQLLLKNGITI